MNTQDIDAVTVLLSSKSRPSLHWTGVGPAPRDSPFKIQKLSTTSSPQCRQCPVFMDIFQYLQERWQFSSPSDDDPEGGVRCGGCCQTPQSSWRVRKYQLAATGPAKRYYKPQMTPGHINTYSFPKSDHAEYSASFLFELVYSHLNCLEQ